MDEALLSIVNTLYPPEDESSGSKSNEEDEENEEEAIRPKRARVNWEELQNLLRPDVEISEMLRPSSSGNPGLCGLKNIGNTCYMNSALQALSNTPSLRRIILGPQGLHVPNTNSKDLRHLLANYIDLSEAMWDGTHRSVAPARLHHDVARVNPLFRGYAQHDSQEFLRTLLDSLHEALKREDYSRYKAPEPSPSKTDSKSEQSKPVKPHIPTESSISSLFEGKLLSTVICGNCHRKSHTLDRFFDLSLPVPTSSSLPNINKRKHQLQLEKERSNGISLSNSSNSDEGDDDGALLNDQKRKANGSAPSMWSRLTSWIWGGSPGDLETCLHGFCLEDELTGQDRYLCENCKSLHDATKSFHIAQLPHNLCLHIKRFKYDFFGSKMSDYIQFPLENLDVTDFCAPPSIVQDLLSGNGNSTSPNNPTSANGKAKGSSKSKKGSSSSKAPLAPSPTLAPTPLYDLYAVICHSGSLHGGHYYAYAKHVGTGQWYEFNDSSVVLVNEETVASAEAYVLFYEQQTSAAKESERERIKGEMRVFFEYQQTLESTGPSELVLPPETRYVSLTWFMKWLCTNSPGPMNNPALTCEHNLPVKRPLAHLVPLPPSVVLHFEKEYGGTFYSFPTEECPQCAKARVEEQLRKAEQEKKLAAVAARRQQENKKVQELGTLLKDPREMKRGYYFLDIDWTKSWLAFARGETDKTPGPINNKPIVSRNKVPNTRYRAINASVWEYLHQQYGGGPELWSATSTLPIGSGHSDSSTTSEDDDDYHDDESTSSEG